MENIQTVARAHAPTVPRALTQPRGRVFVQSVGSERIKPARALQAATAVRRASIQHRRDLQLPLPAPIVFLVFIQLHLLAHVRVAALGAIKPPLE